MHFKISRKCFDKGKDCIKTANVLEGKLVTSDYTRPELIFWLLTINSQTVTVESYIKLFNILNTAIMYTNLNCLVKFQQLDLDGRGCRFVISFIRYSDKNQD